MQQEIFKSYHVSLVEKVSEKTKAKEGKLNDNFLNEEAFSEDKEFRKTFFEEAKHVFNKEGDELKQELQSKPIKFSDKFGKNNDGLSHTPLPNDLIDENEVKEFLSKLKLLLISQMRVD